VRVPLLACLVGLAVLPGWPRFWDPVRSVEAVGLLARGAMPERAPNGAEAFFSPEDGRSPYTWADYRRTIVDLRAATTAEVPVANLLRNVPFPAINGPAGRVTPLTAEGAMAYLLYVDPGVEVAYARALIEAPPGACVVWDPSRRSFAAELELSVVRPVLERGYRPASRAGAIEVWRRRGDVPDARLLPLLPGDQPGGEQRGRHGEAEQDEADAGQATLDADVEQTPDEQ
jgi:hypothetical protein